MISNGFFEKKFIFESSLWTRRKQLWKPCLIFPLKIVKMFAKTPESNFFFWKQPRTFSLEISSGHVFSIFDNLFEICPSNSEKFLPKSKRNMKLVDLPWKTVLLKWFSEHVENSI